VTVHRPPQNVATLTQGASLVTAAVSWLESKSISVWIFGGWAEQLRGLCRPRAHRDIDLLYPCQTWDAIDMLIADHRIEEIVAKRFAHKRAIVWRGTMIELFLVRLDGGRPYTLFWNRVRHDWPADALGYVGQIPVASAAALHGFRSAHDRICQPRERATDVQLLSEARRSNEASERWHDLGGEPLDAMPRGLATMK
jgi:Aminoglycoside-2''-adenylyltransferase